MNKGPQYASYLALIRSTEWFKEMYAVTVKLLIGADYYFEASSLDLGGQYFLFSNQT